MTDGIPNALNPEDQGKSRKNVPPKEHQFQPGQSGNPGGRKKGSGITDRVRAILDKAEGEEGSGADVLADAIVKAAQKGDFRFAKEIWDRMDGPIKQMIEASVVTQAKAIDREAFDGA